MTANISPPSARPDSNLGEWKKTEENRSRAQTGNVMKISLQDVAQNQRILGYVYSETRKTVKCDEMEEKKRRRKERALSMHKNVMQISLIMCCTIIIVDLGGREGQANECSSPFSCGCNLSRASHLSK